MAMIWHGAFIDASRHWTGRGQGFESPLGDDVLPLPDHVPFVVLDRPDREVATELGRDLGYKFLGYRLDKEQRPIFRYSFGGLTIDDHPLPAKDESKKYGTLRRTLRIEGAADSSQLWYRALTSKQIESVGQGRYRVDDVWTFEVSSPASEAPIIRESGGQKELLVPVRLKNGKTEITLNYVW